MLCFLIAALFCLHQLYLLSLTMEEDISLYKTLATSRAMRVDELERRLSESETLRQEAFERVVNAEKSLTLAQEERDKAFTEVGVVSGENADLILKNADLGRALKQAEAERDEAIAVSKEVTARELSTAEEWALKATITTAQEFKDGKSNLWDLELWKKEYEEKFGPFPQESEEAVKLPGGEEEEVSSGIPLKIPAEPSKSTTDLEAGKAEDPK